MSNTTANIDIKELNERIQKERFYRPLNARNE